MDARLTRRYANALYDVAVRRGLLARVAADVELLDETFTQSARLSEAMNNPQVSEDRKKAVLADLFRAQVDPLTLQFCHLLVDKRRVEVLEGLHQEFQKLSDAASGIVRARVHTAVPMTEDQQARLVQQLINLTGKKIILTSSVDPSLRGGVVVWIGDRVIDGSVSGYLASIQARLTA